MIKKDLIIAGAGASGLFCAHLARLRGIDTLVLEAGGNAARKLAICGGGHANFTNLELSANKYLCHADPQFCSPVLADFPAKKLLHYLDTWHLPYERREHGRFFLKVKAVNLAQALLQGVEIKYDTMLGGILPREHGEWELITSNGTYRCATLILALGSPARPGLAPAGYSLNMLKALGHKIIPLRPALAPMNWINPAEPHVARLKTLAGISIPCQFFLKSPGEVAARHWEDDILFTHHGLSGPAVLRASLFHKKGMGLAINFLPRGNLEKMLDDRLNSAGTPRGILRRLLPRRLVDAIVPEDMANIKNSELSRACRRKLSQILHFYPLPPAAPCGLAKAEACAGGIDVSLIDNKTMRSKLWPTLAMAGEMLDVTGELGGYNLHWAFASAWRIMQSMFREGA